MDSNFNSGNFDPNKVNRSGLNQDKQNQNQELPEQAQADEQTTAPSHFNEKDANEILNFMAANSAMNMGKVQQSSVDKHIEQFTSILSPEQYEERLAEFRSVVDQELKDLGRDLSENAKNELAELSLANHLIGTPMVLEA